MSNSAWGRWLSPDPAGLSATDPSNPQSWNRYAYVNDNPLTNTDPLGQLPQSGDALMCVVECGGDGAFNPGSNFFQNQLDAENRNTHFSFAASVDFGNRQTFGNSYYDLPGHANPVQQGARNYASFVNAVSQAGGSTVTWRNGVSVSINWTTTGGVYGMNNANGATLDPGALAEAINQNATTAGNNAAADPTLDNRANALAKAINATGVQTMQNPCLYASWTVLAGAGGAIGVGWVNVGGVNGVVNSAPTLLHRAEEEVTIDKQIKRAVRSSSLPT
jgi:hypothetical protein